MTLKTDRSSLFSSWRNVDNDSADVTSEGRSFHIHAATTGKARLATVDSLTDGTTRRLVTAEQRWTARLISDGIEWSEVLWRKSMQDFVRQDGDLELNSL